MKKSTKLVVGIGVNLAIVLFAYALVSAPKSEHVPQIPEQPSEELDFLDYAEVSTAPPPADDGVIGLATRVVVTVGNSTDTSPP